MQTKLISGLGGMSLSNYRDDAILSWFYNFDHIARAMPEAEFDEIERSVAHWRADMSPWSHHARASVPNWFKVGRSFRCSIIGWGLMTRGLFRACSLTQWDGLILNRFG